MFCPECRAEYRDGFTRCSDCDVDLVERLPENGDANERVFPGEMREVWTGEEQNQCVSICSQLRQAEIPFHVLQGRRQISKDDVDSKFKIGVPAEYFDRAKGLINKENDGSEYQDEEEAQKFSEIPAEDGEDTAEDVSRESRRTKWLPEEATAEVWSEDTLDLSSMIEACLKENGIGSRTDVLENGARKVFVRPEDEARAREIVHEIVEGVPPQ
jgi:hypothetical protein